LGEEKSGFQKSAVILRGVTVGELGRLLGGAVKGKVIHQGPKGGGRYEMPDWDNSRFNDI